MEFFAADLVYFVAVVSYAVLLPTMAVVVLFVLLIAARDAMRH